MGGRSRSQQKDKQPRKVISVSIQQDVKLHTVENAWKPGSKAEKDVSEDPEAILTAVSQICVLKVSWNWCIIFELCHSFWLEYHLVDQLLQEVLKKVRSILNKLTPQKFQTLMQQILDLEISTEERLKGTIDLIFEKVIWGISSSATWYKAMSVNVEKKNATRVFMPYI